MIELAHRPLLRATTRHPPPPGRAAVPRLVSVPSVVWVAPLLLFYVVVCAVAQPGPDPVRDEPALLAAAARMLHGHLVPAGLVTDPRAYLWHGPGLVALLTPLVALHVPLSAIRYVEPLLMGCAALLFYRLLRMRLEPRPALGWTYAFGLYVPFLSVVPEVHKEPLSILLVIVAMSALTRGLVTGRWLSLIGAGVALGGLAMVRLEYGWVAIALLVVATIFWAVRRGPVTAGRLVVVAGVAVATCMPWLAYTYRVTGQAMYWGSSSGLSLYWMSPTEPGETGQWHDPRTVRRDPAFAAYRALFARIRTLDPVGSDRTLRKQAIANIRARPAQYARNLVANAGRLFFATPMHPRLSLLRIGADVLFNSLLLAGVGWAAASLWRRRSSLPPEMVPIALFAAVAVAVHLPASASPRMLLPIVPPLLWLIAQSLSARKRPRLDATSTSCRV